MAAAGTLGEAVMTQISHTAGQNSRLNDVVVSIFTVVTIILSGALAMSVFATV
jgi:hypothetical protein